MREVFASDRISFVEVSEDLVADYLAMVNDAENVGRWIGSTKTYTEENERAWVKKKREKKAPVFSMLEKKTGDFIGNIELIDPENGASELGIAITAKQQDKGFGQEAIPALVRYGMETLGLRRVWLRTRLHNLRAIHVYEKCGFVEKHRDEEHVFMEFAPGNKE